MVYRFVTFGSFQPICSRVDHEVRIMEGVAMRMRSKMVTMTVIVAGLLPMSFGSGNGSEMMG